MLNAARHTRRLVGFVRLIGWYAHDALLRYRLLTTGIIIGGFLALLAQAQAFALTIYYGYLLTEGQPIELMGATVQPQESTRLLIACTTVILVTLLLAAALQYGARIWTLALRRRYSEYCMQRALQIFTGPLASIPPTDGPLQVSDGVRMARADAIKCGRVVSLLPGLTTPALTIVVAAIVLLVLNPVLTLAIGVLAVLNICILYRANVHGVAAARDCEDAARPASEEIRHVIRAASEAQGPLAPVELPRSRLFFKRYVQRLRAADDSEMISNVFLALVFALTIMGLGWQVVRDGQGWEVMAAYLVALRFGLLTFRAIARRLTALNRLYPQARRHHDFINAWRTPGSLRDVDAARPPTPTHFELRLGRSAIDESPQRATIETGQRLRLITPLPLNRLTLPFLLRSIMTRPRPTAESAIHSAHWLSSSNAHGKNEAEQDADANPLLRAAKRIADDTESRWAMVSEDELRKLPEALTRELQEILEDRILVTVAKVPKSAFRGSNDDLVAVCNETGGVALSPPEWMEAHWPAVAGCLAPNIAGKGDDDDIDEDDDE